MPKVSKSVSDDSDPSSRSRWFVLTEWKWDREGQNYREPSTFQFGPNVVYACWQIELAPSREDAPEEEKDGLHLQMCIYFKNNVRFKSVHDIWKASFGHMCTVRRYDGKKSACGNYYGAKEATRKEGPWFYGIAPNQGKRTDWDHVVESIEDGKSVFQVARDQPNLVIPYNRAVKWFQKCHIGLIECPAPVRPPPVLHILYGPPRSHKGHSMWDFITTSGIPSYDMPRSNNGAIWVDGYMGETIMMFDEFTPTLYPIDVLLRLFDRHPYKIATKGTDNTNIFAHTFYITTNFHPSKWFFGHPQFAAMQGRIAEFGILYDFTDSALAIQKFCSNHQK